jgi:hypothetical protein
MAVPRPMVFSVVVQFETAPLPFFPKGSCCRRAQMQLASQLHHRRDRVAIAPALARLRVSLTICARRHSRTHARLNRE